MKEYDFILKFDLPDHESDPDQYIDALFESGCDDATVGVGLTGRVALNFIREATSAYDAVMSAINDVNKAIPGARLIEATPDLVGITDIAEIIGCSRQNMRKLVLTHKAAFPSPVHEGTTAIWHLAKVLKWLQSNGNYEIDDSLIEVSSTNMRVNVTAQYREIEAA